MAASAPLIAGFAVGAVVGCGGTYLYVTRLKPTVRGTLADEHPALQFGMPVTEALRIKEGYVTAFDLRTRNPKWVLEHITEASANGSADRKNIEFHEDMGIEPWLRSKLSDYRNSGYDRGHMAPAADFKGSQTAMAETFNLCNISPQVGDGFNRDYWARFEKFVKDCTRKCDDVWVATGPLWMPSVDDGGKWQMKYPMIGSPPSLLSVATHFYKVVLTKGCSKTKDGRVNADVGVAAFVMPNAPIDPATPLSAFVVPLEPLEALAGARFFPGYISRERMLVLDEVAQDVRAGGLDQMKVLDRQAVLQAMPHQLSLPAPPNSKPGTATSPQQAITTTAAQPSALQAQQPAPPSKQPRTVRGCAHLCDVVGCQLPPEKFWENGGSNSGGRSGNGRGPGRSLSRK